MSAPLDTPEAAEAQAIHKRRALARAAAHGAALIEALDLSPLALDALDEAIAALDAVDGDVDLEDGYDAEHDTADMEDDGTSEPMLGAPEEHPFVPLFSHFYRCGDGRQLLWGQGHNDACNDGEAEPGYDLACDEDERDDEHDGSEPWLGAPENHAAFPDQEHWSQGREGELDPAEDFRDLPLLPDDVRRAYRLQSDDLARAAVTKRRLLTDPFSDGFARPWLGDHRVFSMRVVGDCCAPQILDGGAIHVDRDAKPKAGDFVAVWFVQRVAGQTVMKSWVKRLAEDLWSGMRLPFVPHPDDGFVPMLMLETLNPPRRLGIDLRHVHAVLKVVDILPPAQAIPGESPRAGNSR